MGYHDHNWMNQGMAHLIDHWYWGRGQVGPYSFVTAYITVAKKYGYASSPTTCSRGTARSSPTTARR